MITTNRYDRLTSNKKKLRGKIEKITNKTDVKIKDLRIKINDILYKKSTKIDLLTNKLTDVQSLIENEVKRIYQENENLLKPTQEE